MSIRHDLPQLDETMHLCRLLLQRVGSSLRKPTTPRTQGTLTILALRHSQREQTISSWSFSVIPLTRKTQALEQIWHHTSTNTRYIPKLCFFDHRFYEHYHYGKQSLVPHLTCTLRSQASLTWSIMKVCGPMSQQSLGGALYFVTFNDDAIGKVCAYRTWTKDRVFAIFYDCLAMVEN